MAGRFAPALRVGSNLRWLFRQGVALAALPREPFVLRVRMSSPVPELAPPVWPRGREPVLSLLDIVTVLERAAEDPRVGAVLLRMDGPPGGFARALTLHRAVAAVRERKPVLVWSESYDATDYLVASAASSVWVAEAGGVGWTGLRFEGVFLRDTLEKLGLAPDVIRVGAFKSAAEMLTRTGFSPEHREQLEALADDIWANLSEGVAGARGLEPGAVRALADAGPFTSDAARRAGLIDGTAYPDELEDHVRAAVPALGAADPLPIVDGARYAWQDALPGPIPLATGLPRIAYRIAAGTIVRGRSARGIAAERVVQALRGMEEDEAVRAVVLRVDSGGGEVVASDLLWRGVERLAAAKPVIACFGDTAASGAYYLAAPASEILAEPTTLTGSIGVVGGKLDAGGLLERAGIRTDHVERGKRSGLHSVARGFTPDERSAVREGMEAAYERFLDKVASGRGLDRDAVHARAQGRIWSGRAGLAQGLVDGFGGPLEAIAHARAAAGIPDGAPCHLDVSPRVSSLEGLRAVLGAAD